MLKRMIRYIYVNSINKIQFINGGKENGECFVNTFVSTIEYLPTIQEYGGVACAYYKYYPTKLKNKWYFIKEKETFGKSVKTFCHALENKQNQSNIFLIDCTKSYLGDKEILNKIELVLESKKTNYVDVVFVKNKKEVVP